MIYKAHAGALQFRLCKLMWIASRRGEGAERDTWGEASAHIFQFGKHFPSHVFVSGPLENTGYDHVRSALHFRCRHHSEDVISFEGDAAVTMGRSSLEHLASVIGVYKDVKVEDVGAGQPRGLYKSFEKDQAPKLYGAMEYDLPDDSHQQYPVIDIGFGEHPVSCKTIKKEPDMSLWISIKATRFEPRLNNIGTFSSLNDGVKRLIEEIEVSDFHSFSCYLNVNVS
jgi:hypothetical protein